MFKIPVSTFELIDGLTPVEVGKGTTLVVKVGRRNGNEGGRATRDSSPIVSPTPMQTSKINPPTKMGAPVKRPFTKSAKSRKLSGAGRWTGGNNDRRTNSNNKKKYDGGKGSGVEPDSSGSSAANDGGEEEGGMSLDEQYRMEKEEMEELSNTRLNFARALGAFKPSPSDVSSSRSTNNASSQQTTDVNDNGTSINSNSGNADVHTSEVSKTSIFVDDNRAATLSACVSVSLHLTSLLSLLKLRHTRPTVRVVSENLLQQHGVRWSEIEKVFLGVARKFYLKKDGEIKEWDRWKEDAEDGCSRKEALQRHFLKLESLSCLLPSFTSDSTETKSDPNANDGTSCSKTTSTASSSGANKKKSTTFVIVP
mmetsp:Transcript_6128/g.12191  ORF Transcript_6128/g.12191 Transcript_6128/m.12191 type:complete len:367 (+) Transcript_6128:873-1973(+)